MARLTALFLFVILSFSLTVAQVRPQPVRVADSVMQAQLAHMVDPVNPTEAGKRIEGAVVLQAIIGKSGSVENLQVISGHPMLVTAAIDAVKQWKYQPYLLNGEPVEVETLITLNFKNGDKTVSGVVGNTPGVATPGGSGGSGPIVGRIVSTLPADFKPAPGQRIRVSSKVSQGLLEKKVDPQYPPDAKAQHIQGIVLLQVKIDKEGNVYDVQLISGHPQLAPAAVEAVKQWKYKPYLLNGNPVDVETQITVNFTLAD